MYLDEAVRQSQDLGRGFTRKKYLTKRDSIREPDYSVWFYGTNSILGTLVVDANDHITPRWQPTLEDLTADDWILYG